MKNEFLWLPLLLLLAVSCTDGIYHLLGRPLADPVITPPQVDSFMYEGAVAISWAADICADEYILYRRQDADTAAITILYQGNNLEYLDTHGSSEERYFYSLAKTRGQRTFGPSENVLGVFSNTTRDSVEPNNKKDMAALLESDLEANIYYYRDKSGNALQDEDWYYVNVPPRRTAHVTVIQNGMNEGNTFFNFSQEGEIPFRVVSNGDIAVENYANNAQKLYFKLYPVAGEFVNDVSQAGGTIVGYKISLQSIGSL